MARPTGFSNSARIAAVLAAMAPIMVGVYQQGEEARLRQAQRRDEQRLAVEKKAAAEKEADVATANALQVQLADGNGFCPGLFFAASQLPWQSVTTRTRDVVYAALLLREPEDGRLRACQCSTKSLESLWQFIPSATSEDADRLSQGLKSAIDECIDPIGAKTPEPEVLSLRQQLSAVKADRDSLQAKLLAMAPDKNLVRPPLPLPETTPSCAVTDPGETRRLRVFIQVPDTASKDKAEKLRSALNARPPFKSPRIEIVGARSPSQFEVRYTYPIDSAAAGIVIDAMKACIGVDVKPVFLERYQGRTDTGVIEVWWPRAGS